MGRTWGGDGEDIEWGWGEHWVGMGRTWGGDGEDMGWGWGGHGVGMGRTLGEDGEDMGWGWGGHGVGMGRTWGGVDTPYAQAIWYKKSSGYNPSVHTLRMQLPHLYATLDTSTPPPEAGSTWILSTLVAAVVWAGLYLP